MHRAIPYLSSAGILFLAVACSVKAPEVRVTGEMTSLEKEVLGTYRQIEEETWMVASTRSEEPGRAATISPEKRRVLEAKQRQRFNQDDILEFKKQGFVGESNRGFLELRPSEALDKDPEKAAFVRTLVQEENEDRQVIVERLIELNENLKRAARENVLAIYAEINQKQSPTGTWIQSPDGKWVKKGE